MSGEREVKVTLVAEVAEYEAALERAAERVRDLSKALLELNEITIRIRVERD